MKLSTRTKYGLRALLIIAQSESGVATSEFIANSEGLSKKYLDSILGQLRKVEILKTNRGVNGGYSINKPLGEITVLELFNALEKKNELSECIEQPGVCKRSGFCPGRKIWSRVADAMNTVMQEHTLADLLKEAEDCD